MKKREIEREGKKQSSDSATSRTRVIHFAGHPISADFLPSHRAVPLYLHIYCCSFPFFSPLHICHTAFNFLQCPARRTTTARDWRARVSGRILCSAFCGRTGESSGRGREGASLLGSRCRLDESSSIPRAFKLPNLCSQNAQLRPQKIVEPEHGGALNSSIY